MRLRTPTLGVVARVIPCLIACAVGAAGLSACSSGPAASDRGVTVVRVTVRDFHIKAAGARPGRAGAHSRSPTRAPTRTMILVRGRDAALPLRSDGLTVDEDKLEPARLGEARG